MTGGVATGVSRAALQAMLEPVLADAPPGTDLYLVGDTGHVWEGWLAATPVAVLAVDGSGPDREVVTRALGERAVRGGVPLLFESPADVVPLPRGAAERHLPASGGATPALRHFDPYSVAFRAIARGDEPDYHTVLRSLRHGWLDFGAMTLLLDDVLPRFTLATIAQDPAEFRRKVRGLTQMWRAENGDAARLFGTPDTGSERAPAR